ncbi:MAG: hypothetical protein K2X38_21155 [Gemmataceae bacterium]|nr:hypothetical protein [Gemmataceae bacterium]
MSMLAIVFGLALTVLGGGLYGMSPEPRSPTALIPSAFGIALILCGVIARNEKVRMHAMHFAALIGLVGAVYPAYRAFSAMAGGRSVDLAVGGQLAMAGLCAVFVVLCVKSFIDARRVRKAREAAQA